MRGKADVRLNNLSEASESKPQERRDVRRRPGMGVGAKTEGARRRWRRACEKKDESKAEALACV
eukprot:3207890-Pleurochrysis_carterae.AAC.1